MSRRAPVATCPCGLPARYEDCCGRWHRGAPAPDAVALMRSRYVAYTLGDQAYLLRTWHASTRPASLDLGAGAPPTWLGLEIRQHHTHGDTAQVEFVARHRLGGGRAARLHERSRFVREDGHWHYVDGDILSS